MRLGFMASVWGSGFGFYMGIEDEVSYAIVIYGVTTCFAGFGASSNV